MRIRKKKHLEERLENVREYLFIADNDIKNVNLAIMDKKYLDFSKIFNNDNPIELEIGCGKGGFITEKAKRNKNINYIAVELLSNIVVMAAEKAKEEGLKNILFINSGADYLPRYIKEDSISNIYLNFSPPFNQKGYESHRLTNPHLVENYYGYLKNGGKIIQKTDDKIFFDYSFSVLEKSGFNVTDVSKLLKNDKDNIVTEYELKFINNGDMIYSLQAKKSI